MSHAINKYKYNKDTWRWWAQNVCFVEVWNKSRSRDHPWNRTFLSQTSWEVSENCTPNRIHCICGDDINFWSWRSFRPRTIFKHAALEGNRPELMVTFLDLNLVESLYRTLQRFGEPDLPLYRPFPLKVMRWIRFGSEIFPSVPILNSCNSRLLASQMIKSVGT